MFHPAGNFPSCSPLRTRTQTRRAASGRADTQQPDSRPSALLAVSNGPPSVRPRPSARDGPGQDLGVLRRSELQPVPVPGRRRARTVARVSLSQDAVASTGRLTCHLPATLTVLICHSSVPVPSRSYVCARPTHLLGPTNVTRPHLILLGHLTPS